MLGMFGASMLFPRNIFFVLFYSHAHSPPLLLHTSAASSPNPPSRNHSLLFTAVTAALEVAVIHRAASPVRLRHTKVF